jgi:cobyrinic acid a,c-diamide synthase
MKNAFIVAGTNSGCGKTTITIGLMRLLSRKGMRVSPFKTGPDYIDPAFHGMATGTDSHNLDSYLLAAENVQQLFDKYSNQQDIAVVEGVMGMYDGLGMEGHGSTAELARMLDLPVILVVNCKALYQSVAAIVNGFATLDPRVHIAGVILNHVYSDDQFRFLQQYIEQHCGIACLGYLPPNSEIALESRHLGLIQAGEIKTLFNKIDTIADLLEQHCDIDRLLALTVLADRPEKQYTNNAVNLKGLKLGVAYDDAFSFYYKANLNQLSEDGAKLIYFSPLKDACIPEEVNALYLGGGYPEVFARELSHNRSMCESIRQAVEYGMPVYAECGGLMYLTEGIIPVEDLFYPMCGVFHCRTEMTARLQNFGYCLVDWEGTVTKAHEFHHSRLIPSEQAPNYEMAFEMEKPERPHNWQGGLRYKNVLAGYPHIHFYSNDAFYKKITDLWTNRTIQ